jgi:hypothetical protein
LIGAAGEQGAGFVQRPAFAHRRLGRGLKASSNDGDARAIAVLQLLGRGTIPLSGFHLKKKPLSGNQ